MDFLTMHWNVQPWFKYHVALFNNTVWHLLLTDMSGKDCNKENIFLVIHCQCLLLRYVQCVIFTTRGLSLKAIKNVDS